VATLTKRAEPLPPDPVPGDIRVNAAPHDVRQLAEWLKDRCATLRVSDEAAVDLELAMVEAANNIVEHGYLATAPGEIGLSLDVADGAAVLTLADRGTPAPVELFSRCREMPLEATEGRGIGIVQSCVDQIRYDTVHGVNRLTLIKRLA
jgi:serine/threonine-protein kinase RsbW